MEKHDFAPPNTADPKHGAHAYHCRRCDFLVVGDQTMPIGTYTEQTQENGKPMITVPVEQSRDLSKVDFLPPCPGSD